MQLIVELSAFGAHSVVIIGDEFWDTGIARGPYPLVIGTNGLDVFAAESGPLVRDLLERGSAVLTSDIPGAGMNSAIPLQPDSGTDSAPGYQFLA